MLDEVKLPDPERVLGRYPHQLSGGQQQRIVIAMALIAEPALLIMDEPTTGLDVTVEAAVLDLVRELRRRHETSILFISHNLGTVVRVCDRVGVMYAGELVEEGSIRQVFGNPRHPYTRGLLDCLPSAGRDKRRAPLVPIAGQVSTALIRPIGCGFAARCPHVEPARCVTEKIATVALQDEPAHRVQCVRAVELPPWKRRDAEAGDTSAPAMAVPAVTVTDLRKLYRPRARIFGSGKIPVRALNGVSLTAARGQTLALVGESGCGKSTLARVLAGLETASGGRVELDGRDVATVPVESRPLALKRSLQMVFQNPDSTLNPSHTVGYAIGRALRRLRGLSSTEAEVETLRLLDVVKLPRVMAARKPDQLSGDRSSAWPSRARWPAIPTSSWPTSPCRRWTFRCRPRSSTC